MSPLLSYKLLSDRSFRKQNKTQVLLKKKSLNKNEKIKELNENIEETVRKLYKDINFFEQKILLPLNYLKTQSLEIETEIETMRKELEGLKEKVSKIESNLYPLDNKNISVLIKKEARVKKEIENLKKEQQKIKKIDFDLSLLIKKLHRLKKKIIEIKIHENCPSVITQLRLNTYLINNSQKIKSNLNSQKNTIEEKSINKSKNKKLK